MKNTQTSKKLSAYLLAAVMLIALATVPTFKSPARAAAGNPVTDYILSGTELTILEDAAVTNAAWAGDTTITKVTIGPNVTIIGGNAFSLCTGITEVDFSGATGLVDIGSGAFRGCTSLTAVDLRGWTNTSIDTMFATSYLEIAQI